MVPFGNLGGSVQRARLPEGIGGVAIRKALVANTWNRCLFLVGITVRTGTLHVTATPPPPPVVPDPPARCHTGGAVTADERGGSVTSGQRIGRVTGGSRGGKVTC